MKQNQLKLIKDFKSRYALDASEENVVTTIHLMSTHVIDKDTALDQSSLRNSDFGIDGWYFDKNNNGVSTHLDHTAKDIRKTQRDSVDFGIKYDSK